MRPVYNEKPFGCPKEYQWCKNASCSLNVSNVKRGSLFRPIHWPTAHCPYFAAIIADDTFNHVVRSWLKDAGVYGKVRLPIPDEFVEFYEGDTKLRFKPWLPPIIVWFVSIAVYPSLNVGFNPDVENIIRYGVKDISD